MRHEAFYSAAAQVFPILVLAVIFQTRIFREGPLDDPGLAMANW